MRNLLMASAVLLVFSAVHTVFASDKFASGPSTPAMGYYFCQALEDPTPAASKGKSYFSGIFIADGRAVNSFRAAYIKFLQEKYQYAQDPTTLDSSVQCVGTNSTEEAAAAKQTRLKPGKDRNPEGTFETGWTLGA